MSSEYFPRAVAAHREGRLGDAETLYRECLQQDAADLRARAGLAGLLLQQARTDQALAEIEAALAFAPSSGLLYGQRALARQQRREFQAAADDYQRALALGDDATLRFNHANALGELRRFDEALAEYDRALALDPGFAAAQRNRGILKLLLGDYEGGLFDYESRRPPVSRRAPSVAPAWRGQPLKGRSLLVTDATGMGDEIHMVRYLPMLVAQGVRVAFVGKPALYRLFAPIAALGVELLPEMPPAGYYDYQCKLLSLPYLCDTRLATVPAQVPYLHAEPERAAAWRERIGTQGFRIGVGWKGNPSRSIDAGRAIPLAGLRELAALPGVRLIALQKNFGLEELDSLPEGMRVETLEDFDEGPDAFVDTAAVMANLDLVISSCTSLPHLAGALARPVWLAAKYVPEWRWAAEGEGNAWYPTMRVFRQESQDDWTPVFARMRDALAARLNG